MHLSILHFLHGPDYCIVPSSLVPSSSKKQDPQIPACPGATNALANHKYRVYSTTLSLVSKLLQTAQRPNMDRRRHSRKDENAKSRIRTLDAAVSSSEVDAALKPSRKSPKPKKSASRPRRLPSVPQQTPQAGDPGISPCETKAKPSVRPGQKVQSPPAREPPKTPHKSSRGDRLSLFTTDPKPRKSVAGHLESAVEDSDDQIKTPK